MFNSSNLSVSDQPKLVQFEGQAAAGDRPRAPDLANPTDDNHKRDPSNSPLCDKTFSFLDALTPSDPYQPYCLKVDRLTILADTTMYKDQDGELTSLPWRRWTNHPDVICRTFAKWPYLYQFKTASGYSVQFAAKDAPCPEVRIDFNPATMRGKWSSLQLLFSCLRDPRLSRIDLCIDYPFDLSDWTFSHTPSLKECVHYGTGRKVETHYLGSRRSPLFIRIYNKVKEAKLTRSTPLWRVEAEFKPSADIPLHSIRPFSGLRIWQPGHGLSFQERAALYYLADHPSAWADLSAPTSRKYRRLSAMGDLSIDLDPQPSAIFDRQFPKLLDRLNPVLSLIPFGDTVCNYNMEDFTDEAV
jgi:hypothetical protein